MSSTPWGITEQTARILYLQYGGRVMLNNANRDGGPPSLSKIIQYNKKRATIRVGTRTLRVQLSELKPPSDYIEPAKQIAQEQTMPPEIAPRKATPVVFTPPKPNQVSAQTAHAQEETVRGDLLVIAAQLSGFGAKIQAARDALAAAEAEYKAAKELRDEEAANLEKVQGEFARMKSALVAASDKLGGA